jgi:hypothetical protein
MRFAPILALSALVAMVVACTNVGTPLNDDRLSDQDRAQTGGSAENSGAGSTTAPPAAPPPPAAPARMTFFITSTGSGALGGNLGGLAGADKKCQDLATAVNAGDRTWHAYLSAEGVNAKDRIGPGPWVNQKGVTIAASLTALHDDFFNPQDMDMIDEKGAAVPEAGRYILTGTKRDGTALPDTCENWTSNTNGRVGRVGDSASRSSSLLAAKWNDNAASYGCSEATLKANKVEGRLYCFSVEP